MKYYKLCSDALKQKNSREPGTDFKTALLELCRLPINTAIYIRPVDYKGRDMVTYFLQRRVDDNPIFFMADENLLAPMCLHVTPAEVLTCSNTLDAVCLSMQSKATDFGWAGGPITYKPGMYLAGQARISSLPFCRTLPDVVKMLGFPPVRGPVFNLEELLESFPKTPVPGLAAACERYIRSWGSGGGDYNVEESVYNACTTDNPRELARRTYAAAKLEMNDEDTAWCLVCCMIQDALPEAPMYEAR